jgi:hypothetical protein
MQEFPPNSSKARVPDEPKVERITSAETVRRKRSLRRQFKETFVGGDMKSVMHYMMLEVVVPAIQDTLIDAFQGGVERLIRGENVRSRRSMPGGGYNNLGHVAYDRMRTGPPRAQQASPRMLSRRARARMEFDEIIIPSRQEAEEVIERMFDVLSRYGSVSVALLYEMTGVQASHTDHKWGWTELRGAKAVRLRQGGFLLDLPDPEPFN